MNTIEGKIMTRDMDIIDKVKQQVEAGQQIWRRSTIIELVVRASGFRDENARLREALEQAQRDLHDQIIEDKKRIEIAHDRLATVEAERAGLLEVQERQESAIAELTHQLADRSALAVTEIERIRAENIRLKEILQGVADEMKQRIRKLDDFYPFGMRDEER